MDWWVHILYQRGDIVLLVSWIFWVIFSICLHELAHGWAAIWQGDDTPRELGHMTMNPLVHMGGMSLIVFAIVGIAWGMMPTDPSRYRSRRRGRIYVAAAGPAMNVGLAIVCGTALAFVLRYAPETQFAENVITFLEWGALINVVLAVFNLLPVPPLDGSQILSGISFRFYQLYQHPNAPLLGMFAILAIFISGIGRFLFLGAAVVVAVYSGLLEALLP